MAVTQDSPREDDRIAHQQQHADQDKDVLVDAEKMSPSDVGSSSRDGSEKPDPVGSPSQTSTEQPSPDETGDVSDEKAGAGAPLDRVPSQAQKLGKKKIVVVMTALCVCPLLFHASDGSIANHMVF